MTIIKKISIDENHNVLLMDWSTHTYGLVCHDKFNNVLWSIKHDDKNPFTNIFLEDDGLKAVKWNGSSYYINIHNAQLTPDKFLK